MLLLLLVSKKKAPKSRKMSTWILGITNFTIKRVHDVHLDAPMNGICVDNRSGTHGDHTIGKMCLDNLINSVRFPPKVVGWPTKTVQNGVMRYKKDIPAEGVAIQTNSRAKNKNLFSSPNSCSGPRRVLTSFFKAGNRFASILCHTMVKSPSHQNLIGNHPKHIGLPLGTVETRMECPMGQHIIEKAKNISIWVGFIPESGILASFWPRIWSACLLPGFVWHNRCIDSKNSKSIGKSVACSFK